MSVFSKSFPNEFTYFNDKDPTKKEVASLTYGRNKTLFLFTRKMKKKSLNNYRPVSHLLVKKSLKIYLSITYLHFLMIILYSVRICSDSKDLIYVNVSTYI